MSKDKIAIVIHRFNSDICGGSETHCRLLAEQLSSIYDIDILTTTAIDDSSWTNELSEGIEILENYNIHRFHVNDLRDFSKEANLKKYITSSINNDESDLKFLKAIGPYSEDLINYVRRNWKNYKAVIFYTYYFATFTISSINIPNRIYLPTLHDEDLLQLGYLKKLFSQCKYYIFNSEQEKSLLETKIGKIKQENYVCPSFGMNEPRILKSPSLIGKHEKYIIYAGRICEGKGCDRLLSAFCKFKLKYPKTKLKLVLIGKLDLQLPKSKDIIYLGFVSEEEKLGLIRNAKALVNPSLNESLSIVCLESLLLDTPIVVDCRSSVLLNHVERSGFGKCFKNEEELIQLIQSISEDSLKFDLNNGRNYVLHNYNWNKIVNEIKNLIERMDRENDNNIDYLTDPSNFKQLSKYPFSLQCRTIVFSSDENYVPFFCFAINSLKKLEVFNNLKIFLLSDNISYKTKKQLTQEFNNLEVIECSGILNKYSSRFQLNTLPRSTLSRFLMLDLLKNDKTALYLDCDILIRNDIRDLMNLDISEFYFAACPDSHIQLIRKLRKETTMYFEKELNFKNTRPYFNAGVLLFNLELLRQRYTTSTLLEEATKKKWFWEDQDILNNLSENKVYWLDYKWNFIELGDSILQNLMGSDPIYFEASENPTIVHFAGGLLPTKNQQSSFYAEFWVNARSSLFYERVLTLSSNGNLSVKDNKIIKFDLIRKTFKYYKENGYKKTYRKIISKLKKY